MGARGTFLRHLNNRATFTVLICAGNYKQIAGFHGHQNSRRHQLPLLITCKFCVEDLFILLPNLLLVVFQQPLTQVAHLLQCKRRLVLSWGTWWTEPRMSRGLTSGSSHRTGWQQGENQQGDWGVTSDHECVRFHDNRKPCFYTGMAGGQETLWDAFQAFVEVCGLWSYMVGQNLGMD